MASRGSKSFSWPPRRMLPLIGETGRPPSSPRSHATSSMKPGSRSPTCSYVAPLRSARRWRARLTFSLTRFLVASGRNRGIPGCWWCFCCPFSLGAAKKCSAQRPPCAVFSSWLLLWTALSPILCRLPCHRRMLKEVVAVQGSVWWLAAPITCESCHARVSCWRRWISGFRGFLQLLDRFGEWAGCGILGDLVEMVLVAGDAGLWAL